MMPVSVPSVRILVLQARGWDKGVQTLQKFSDVAGGWRCFQTMPIPVSMDDRVPEEATDFSRGPSGDRESACARGESERGGEREREKEENEIDLSMCVCMYECVALGHNNTRTCVWNFIQGYACGVEMSIRFV